MYWRGIDVCEGFIGVLWQAGSYPMLFCFCRGSCHCTRPVAGQFPVPPVSVVFHCNLYVCVCNDVLVLLKCIMFRAFWPVLYRVPERCIS